MDSKYLSIYALTRYLKTKFDTDNHLKSVFLKGEISNLKKHSTGHYYFSLKDENSKINAMMFSSSAKNINFNLTDGMKVLVHGRISVYEQTGSYQIYVDEMLEDGVGNLHILYEQLKEKLLKEGLFDKKYKKEIPKIPNKIGIVTAPTGAAIKDILSTIKRRFPNCETLLFPALVQGEYAKDDISNKIKLANNYDIDVLIIGRGGGSIEDLWAFNEEVVARAIFDSKVPIISAVGHEVDFTIADFVADLRAPTPTAAAELATTSKDDLLKLLNQYKIRCLESINKKVNYNKLLLNNLSSSFVLKNPSVLYESKKTHLINLTSKIESVVCNNISYNKLKLNNLKNSYVLNNVDNLYKIKYKELDVIKSKLNKNIIFIINNKKNNYNLLKSSFILKDPNKLYLNSQNKLLNIIDKLELINPLSVLKRGYSVTYKDNKIIKDIKNININDEVSIKLENGIIKSKVIDVKEN